MKCPECMSNMYPNGYSIFDIVYLCENWDCGVEVEIERNEKTEYIVDKLKCDMGIDNK